MKQKKSKTMLSRGKFILAVVLTAVMVAGMTGCSELVQILEYLGEDFYLGGGNEEYNDSYDSVAQPDSANAKILPDLPDSDFSGYNFRILTDKNNSASIAIAVEEETGEPINDSVYRRNRLTEAKYNIKIYAVFPDDPYTMARKSIMAGDDSYDAYAIPLNISGQMSAQGFLVNLYNIPYIDLSKPWWSYKAAEQLSISNQLYFMTGDMLTSDKNASSVIYFNKRLLMDYGLEDPYTLVRNGLWTVDKLNEMVKTTTVDINGDGKMSASDDIFGFITGADMLYDSVLSSGSFVIEKDKNNLPVVNMTERMVNSFHKWADIYYDGSRTAMLEDSKEKIAIFNQNRGLFLNDRMALASEMRRNETQFGILPNPKFDVKQESYINAVNPAVAGAVSVPVTNSDLERTGIILEALTAESYYAVLPAYYDVALMGKFTRDDESAEMLDIIFNSRVYDLGQIHNIGEINEIINDMAVKRNTELVAQYEKSKGKLEKATEKLVVMLESLK